MGNADQNLGARKPHVKRNLHLLTGFAFAIVNLHQQENDMLYIEERKTRSGRTAYIICTASGAEFKHFWRKDRAEAWLRNEIYA
jgi:hypothetical protein